MEPPVHEIPRVAPDEAARIARDIFGVAASARSLVGERDQNFHLRTDAGDEYVLKIAHPNERRSMLEAQHRAMEHVAAAGITCPVPCAAISGRTVETLENGAGEGSLVSLLRYLPGRVLAEVRPRTPALLVSVGRLLARLDQALSDFRHPAVRRRFHWDLRHASSTVEGLVRHIDDAARRALVERCVLQFDADVVPELPSLPTSVIHNDANDHNVLVHQTAGAAPAAIGIIDFGDMVESHTVFEVAVGAAYALLDESDPLAAAASVVEGYHDTAPLGELEVELLFDLIVMRLSLSVTLAAYQARHDSANRYLRISEPAAWRALERLTGGTQRAARAAFQAACGRAGSPTVFAPSNHETILDARHRLLGPTLSVAYRNPLKVVRGRMQYLFDETGRAYLDGVNNVCHVGHCHPAVVAAGQRQMAILNTNTRYLHDTIVEYARRLVATLPEPLRICYFVCSGSEANEMALRLARAHTRRRDVIVVEGAYHGNTTSLIDISPYKFNGPGGPGAPEHVHTVPTPDVFRGRFRDPITAGQAYAEPVAVALRQPEGMEVAAFFAESLLSCAGQIVLPPGYLPAAYGAVRDAGGVCVADEVQVGFGRVGSHFWGFELQNVVPDIVTLGKPMGNGHPLGAVVTTPAIAASFDTGMEYFNTFGGNPVSCAVGLAVLDVIEREGLQSHALEVGTHLKARIAELQRVYPLIGEVRGEGLFLGVELVRDRATLEPASEEAAAVIEGMRERGVLVSTDGPFDNVIKIKPPLVFSRENAEYLVRSLRAVIEKVGDGC